MDAAVPKPAPRERKLRWFQFGLRSLLIFTVILGVSCALVMKRVEQKRRERESVAAIQKLGGDVMYDWEIANVATPPGPEWMRDLLGENCLSEVEIVSLAEFTSTDADLELLEPLTSLQKLCVARSNFGEAALEPLSEHIMQPVLTPGGTSVSDSGLMHLARLTELKWLDLRGAHVSDAGLVHLRGLRKLEWLDLRGTNVTDAGVNDLQKALTNCLIDR